MLTKVIEEHTIDGVVNKILDELKEDTAGTTSSSAPRNHVIYFDGWDGLGASAVLRAVVRRLTQEAGSSASAATGLEFSHIFHIDCSKCVSRRAMQRVIAEELKLPASVMEMMDAQDEEDDYKGLPHGSRAEVPQVAGAIYEQVQKLVMNNKSLVIFHNGSTEEIDLDSSFGFPLSGYSRNKLLWSFQGRFRMYPRKKVDRALKNSRKTDVFLSADCSDIGKDELSDILHREAEEVAREMTVNTVGFDTWLAAATSYFLYVMKLHGMGNHIHDYDMSTHACNYWRCDGGMIISPQKGDDVEVLVDRFWLSSDALHREIQLDVDYYQNPNTPSSVERHLHNPMAHWASPTYGFMLIPDPNGQVPVGMFQQFDKICVLKLSACEFSFTSPPFLCCCNLRFLCLDHCKDIDEDNKQVEETDEVRKEDIRQYKQRLWVLDVRYSAFMNKLKAYMMDLIGLKELHAMGEDNFDTELFRKLRNIRKLQLTKTHIEGYIFLSGMDKMEVLNLSENKYVTGLAVKSCCSLETVIIKGSSSLVDDISFTQCAKLKNVFFSGSFQGFMSIKITGAIVEILDLSAVTAWNLYKLNLLDCEKLCAILWPAAEGRWKIYLDYLVIDTTQKEGTNFAGDHQHSTRTLPVECDWQISVKDARILRSLENVRGYFDGKDAHLEISSPTQPLVEAAGRKDRRIESTSEQLKENATYGDVAAFCQKYTNIQQQLANEAECDAPNIMFMCPPPPSVPHQGCYVHIGDHLRTKSQDACIILPGFICDCAKILHVHDSLHTTGILTAPFDSTGWNQLEWCRIKGCPMLECVFSPRGGRQELVTTMFKKLRTAWASNLPNARYIWKWTWTGPALTWFRSGIFEDLILLHVNCCHKLINIIHLPAVEIAFDRLERLEIMWCSDLIVAFNFYDIIETFDDWCFPKLKHVYLHELPKLQNIGNFSPWFFMPKLETIKIRGCWSLRRLPIVQSMDVIECDCEKEWWDMLEWELPGHKSQYKPIHPRYFKKTMLRGSVLR